MGVEWDAAEESWRRLRGAWWFLALVGEEEGGTWISTALEAGEALDLKAASVACHTECQPSRCIPAQMR